MQISAYLIKYGLICICKHNISEKVGYKTLAILKLGKYGDIY